MKRKQGRAARLIQLADFTVWPLGRAARVWYDGPRVARIGICNRCGRRGVGLPYKGERHGRGELPEHFPAPVVLHRLPVAYPGPDVCIFSWAQEPPTVAEKVVTR